ncbi:MAG: IclR family transcriptional regulator [Thermocrispum sp.]
MPGSVQSVERAAAILRLLARGPGSIGLGDVATALGLSKSTTHGLLRTLRGVGFVEQDDVGRYRLGAEIGHLAARPLDVNELRARAINWADGLAARSGEVVRIGSLREGNVLVVHHVFRPDDTQQTLDVGTMLPSHATALGKVLLAYDKLAAARVTGRLLTSFTRRTVTGPAALRTVLSEVRSRGWASESGEWLPGEASIAAPIRAPGGLVVGAVGVSGSAERVCERPAEPDATLLAFVRDAARAVSRDLGTAR